MELVWTSSNVTYTESEDFLGTLSTIDETSQQTQASASLLKQIFAIYKMDFELHSVVVKEVKTDSATVTVDMTTKKVEGPEFKNNRSVSDYQYNKINCSWRIAGSLYVRPIS